ncbi:hypothetical protein [Sphingomonas azotifigens]|uniref:hypothetical protein n=1 Tax=Sphingomonas azotifigens TaxID=330920 RepID=UPI001FE4F3B3|nr:hypothetical protein [Sphingomonas azotifigens]
MNAAFAPQKLWQSINPGWSFGNVIINDQNSRAPQTEQRILSRESYGRQIGKLLDAVGVLVERQSDHADNKAFVQLTELAARIEDIKRDAAVDRIARLRSDLETLRDSDRPEDQAAFQANLEALRTLVREVG